MRQRVSSFVAIFFGALAVLLSLLFALVQSAGWV
jgi:hypothetical protein